MLDRMTAAEFMQWAEVIAGQGHAEKMAPAEIRNNLRLAFATRRRKG